MDRTYNDERAAQRCAVCHREVSATDPKGRCVVCSTRGLVPPSCDCGHFVEDHDDANGCFMCLCLQAHAA